jgi:hypothetical protein
MNEELATTSWTLNRLQRRPRSRKNFVLVLCFCEPASERMGFRGQSRNEAVGRDHGRGCGQAAQRRTGVAPVSNVSRGGSRFLPPGMNREATPQGGEAKLETGATPVLRHRAVSAWNSPGSRAPRKLVLMNRFWPRPAVAAQTRQIGEAGLDAARKILRSHRLLL